MRALVLLLGFTGVVGAASAGDLNSPLNDTNTSMGRVMFETRFGGEQPGFTQSSYQLQFGTEHQFNMGRVPFRTEYRPGTNSVLLNGVELRSVVANQFGEETSLMSSLVGWFPVILVASAVAFVVVDGHNSGSGVSTSGSGGV